MSEIEARKHLEKIESDFLNHFGNKSNSSWENSILARGVRAYEIVSDKKSAEMADKQTTEMEDCRAVGSENSYSSQDIESDGISPIGSSGQVRSNLVEEILHSVNTPLTSPKQKDNPSKTMMADDPSPSISALSEKNINPDLTAIIGTIIQDAMATLHKDILDEIGNKHRLLMDQLDIMTSTIADVNTVVLDLQSDIMKSDKDMIEKMGNIGALQDQLRSMMDKFNNSCLRCSGKLILDPSSRSAQSTLLINPEHQRTQPSKILNEEQPQTSSPTASEESREELAKKRWNCEYSDFKLKVTANISGDYTEFARTAYISDTLANMMHTMSEFPNASMHLGKAEEALSRNAYRTAIDFVRKALISMVGAKTKKPANQSGQKNVPEDPVLRLIALQTAKQENPALEKEQTPCSPCTEEVGYESENSLYGVFDDEFETLRI